MRILFITSTRIGDAVLSSGLLAHLVERYPGARLTVACGPLPAVLFQDVPGLERIIVMRKSAGGVHWLALWAQVVGEKWDIVVDLRSSAISYLLLTKARYIKGNSDLHRVVESSRLFALDPPASPQIFAGSTVRKKAMSLMGEGPILAIGPTANWIGKTWPVDRYKELVMRLTSEGAPFDNAKVLVLGAAHERAQVADLLEAIPSERRLDYVGGLDLLTAYACLELSSFYIGNDSGLMHLAAAAGIPTVGLFGPSNEDIYGPWGTHTRTVRGDKSFADVQTEIHDWSEKVCHMTSLSVEQVAQAALSLWNDCSTTTN